MARGFNYAPGASLEVQEAQQPELDKARVTELGSSKNALVRAAIAARPDCPLGLMVTLAHDYSADVRAAVARNPHAQRTVMAYLSADRHVDVLKALLENPALPREIVEELVFHKKAPVRAVAAERLDEGEMTVASVEAEDSHTPEVAEHVAPITMDLPMTADGSVAPEPSNVVDIATGAPVPPAPAPVMFPHVEQPQVRADEPAWAVPQIFAPHSTADRPAPTRTAPVRGFKPKD